jgi:hypothetical protein
MHPLGMLGPIDPTTTGAFNPRDPQQQLLGISVEDVAAYVALVKEDVGITHEDELVQAFNILGQQVHPLALGNVKRTTQQSRMMARKLLAMHMDKATEDHKIEQIVESLSSKLYYHGHPINRKEAKEDLGLDIVSAESGVEDAMWAVYKHYEDEMSMADTFNAGSQFLATFANPAVNDVKVAGPFTTALAGIDSEGLGHRFMIEYEIAGTRAPNLAIVTQLVQRSGNWQVTK